MNLFVSHVPRFIIKNDSDRIQKIFGKWALAPGNQIDLCSAPYSQTELQIFQLLLSDAGFISLIRQSEITVVQSNILNQFQTGGFDNFNAQYPLKIEDGLLSIETVTRTKPGIFPAEDFAKLNSTADTARVWISTMISKDDGPEIQIDLRDDRIICLHPETSTVRSKLKPKRGPKKDWFSKQISIKYVTQEMLVLTGTLPEDAIFWIQATVSFKDATAMASSPPSNIGTAVAHQMQLSSASGKFGELESKTAKIKELEVDSLSTSIRSTYGFGLAVDGQGAFKATAFPYTSEMPPNSAYDGMIWFKPSEGHFLFWSEKDSGWYLVNRRVLRFNGSDGLIMSEDMGYRSAGYEGIIDKITIETQGSGKISLTLDGKTVLTDEVSGVKEISLNFPCNPNTRIKLFQDRKESASMFTAEVSIRIRVA